MQEIQFFIGGIEMSITNHGEPITSQNLATLKNFFVDRFESMSSETAQAKAVISRVEISQAYLVVLGGIISIGKIKNRPEQIAFIPSVSGKSESSVAQIYIDATFSIISELRKQKSLPESGDNNKPRNKTDVGEMIDEIFEKTGESSPE